MITACEPTSVPAGKRILKTTALLILLCTCSFAFAQNQAAHFTGNPTVTPYQTYQCGNIPISGHFLTVEAIMHYEPNGNWKATSRLVDKPSNTDDPLRAYNSVFALRFDGCSIRTTNGSGGDLFDNGGPYGPDVYHVAMT